MSPERSLLTPELRCLLRERARTFSFAARFLPPAEREAVVVIYAFCRMVDDLVDEPPEGTSAEAMRDQLAAWRRWLAGPERGAAELEPAGLAGPLAETIGRYRVPVPYLLALLDGVESDIDPVAMPDFAALRRYCMRVAGSVGLVMCHVLGATRPAALAAAADLGVAMQLTNVLRDVGADLRAGRCYIPGDELRAYGFTLASLRELAERCATPTPALRRLLRFQIARARAFYGSGLEGVWLLPPAARPAILIAGWLYRAILDSIENCGYDVLRRRAMTSRLTKARGAVGRLLLARFWGGPGGKNGAGPGAHNLDEVLSWLG